MRGLAMASLLLPGLAWPAAPEPQSTCTSQDSAGCVGRAEGETAPAGKPDLRTTAPATERARSAAPLRPRPVRLPARRAGRGRAPSDSPGWRRGAE